jgi:hypothetical protein
MRPMFASEKKSTGDTAPEITPDTQGSPRLRCQVIRHVMIFALLTKHSWRATSGRWSAALRSPEALVLYGGTTIRPPRSKASLSS